MSIGSDRSNFVLTMSRRPTKVGFLKSFRKKKRYNRFSQRKENR